MEESEITGLASGGSSGGEVAPGEPKEARPGTFQPGDPRINRSGRPKDVVAEEDEVPRVLRDLRYVYKHKQAAPNESRGRQALRDLWEKDPSKFVDRLLKAEAEHRRGAAKGRPASEVSVVGPEAPKAPDIGKGRAKELLRKLLESKGWLAQS